MKLVTGRIITVAFRFFCILFWFTAAQLLCDIYYYICFLDRSVCQQKKKLDRFIPCIKNLFQFYL